MNFKKVTTAILIVAALAATPCMAESVSFFGNNGCTVSAASSSVSLTSNGVKYTITTSGSTQYATVSDTSCQKTDVTIPATVTYNGKKVPVTKFQSIGSYVQTLKFDCSSITILSGALCGNRSISSITFSGAVQNISIQQDGCSGMPGLRYVGFENSTATVELGKYAFGSSVVKNIKMPRTLKLTTIPEGCFQYCNLTGTNLQIPDAVKRIEKNAFLNTSFSTEIVMGQNLTYVDPTAFTYAGGNLSKFTVDSRCKVVKAVNNALYSADGTILYCYPPNKVASDFVCSATIIPDGAIYNNKSLRVLNISKYARRSGDTSNFSGLSNLERLVVSSSEWSNSNLMSRFNTLFRSTRLHNINGVEMVVVPSNREPYFHSKFESYILNHFEEFQYSYFMEQYNDIMSSYVVNTVITGSMTELEKAVKLQKWILERVTYDPSFQTDLNDSNKNQQASSVFLYQKDGKRYAVCIGYATCYTMLLRKAGIEAYTAGGAYKGQDIVGHAWNMVKIGGKWYQVDTCWDDERYDSSKQSRDFGEYYKYFMCTDNSFRNDNHNLYGWNNLENPSKSLPSAYTDNTKLGDADQSGKYDSKDLTAINNLIGNTVTSDQKLINADLNMDGKITSADYNLMKNYLNSGKTNIMSPKRWVMMNFE